MSSPIPGILSVLTFLPLVGALVLLFLSRPKDLPDAHDHHDDEHGEHHAPATPEPAISDPARIVVNGVATFFAGLTFLVSLVLFGAFSVSYKNDVTRNMQFIENYRWISVGNLSIHYKMGVDGISLLLIVLTTFLMLLSVLYSTQIRQRLREFMVFLLLLESAMIGVFCALDLVLFYVFWEAMLIPMYFLIGIFGHENRIYAAIKFFLYTFAGSVFMLIAIVGVYQVAGSFDIVALSNSSTTAGAALHGFDPRMLTWMFAAFALAFMIKVPMFPFHTWLPDAHVEAPTAGSVILAGVMLKMGTYGFVRLCLPLFPEAAKSAAPLFITLAIIGIVYGSIVAAVQPDAKKLVAYSSVAHLGFVILGIFTFTRVGMMGALIQNINHGIATPMLFFLVGMLYDRRHTRLISEYGGLKLIVPMMATMTLIATLASVAVPFFNGFVGEFPILLGSWSSVTVGYGPTAIAATGMILSAVYMLWWFQRIMLGPVTKPVNRRLRDMTRTEWYVLTPLAAMVFWIGLGSNYWTQRMDTAVNTLLPIASNDLAENIDSSLPIADKIYHDRFASGERTQRLNKRTVLENERRNSQTPPGGGRPLSPGGAVPGRRVTPQPGGPGGMGTAPGARPQPNAAPQNPAPGGSGGASRPGNPAGAPQTPAGQPANPTSGTPQPNAATPPGATANPAGASPTNANPVTNAATPKNAGEGKPEPAKPATPGLPQPNPSQPNSAKPASPKPAEKPAPTKTGRASGRSRSHVARSRTEAHA